MHLARQNVTLGSMHHSDDTVSVVGVHTLHHTLGFIHRVVDVEFVIYWIIACLHTSVLVECLVAHHVSCNVVHPFRVTAYIVFESHDGVHGVPYIRGVCHTDVVTAVERGIMCAIAHNRLLVGRSVGRPPQVADFLVLLIVLELVALSAHVRTVLEVLGRVVYRPGRHLGRVAVRVVCPFCRGLRSSVTFL